MAFSHDGKILAGTAYKRMVRLFDATSGKILADLEAPNPLVISGLSFSPDDTQLAVCESRVKLRIWDLRWVREQLASMKLNWDMPPYPPEDPTLTNRPLRVIVHTNSPADSIGAARN